MLTKEMNCVTFVSNNELTVVISVIAYKQVEFQCDF